MSLHLSYSKKILNFRFAARTSRGAMHEHVAYFLRLQSERHKEFCGIGECSPLPGLSIDFGPDFENNLKKLCDQFNQLKLDDTQSNFEEIYGELPLSNLPAIRFGLETALTDWSDGGTRILFNNSFSSGEKGIPINGLIWMGDRAFMEEQVHKKLEEGYSCLKLKIGGLDFSEELEVLKLIRSLAPADKLTIRLDANGAFSPDEALSKLKKLAEFSIHSIEQPIRQGQWQQMAEICKQSPVPVALDEELIGVERFDQKKELLEKINPQYLIFKPTLIGGFSACHEWIELAHKHNTGWWMTSALESNVGLNAISQFTVEFPIALPHGLGTGQLYHNNIQSPLQIQNGQLFYNKQTDWEELCSNTF
ncbi:MAG: o-succinylbenzoate synthase [Hymenobacteraceae bacterium]|nr:o-succinylbenzoate synthase [Hymenobacteraceae bacterium]MDX5396741.1 o-succinylbenzoate synthase [Hymenobacteraceae bacterium]MDX5442608.1 o-succinylbenzoate synthase [Hymenobacteraceae bacterium]MDX5512803.1 o-succinylbenzoate synthase [Hymenobacteraceae bacterium]